MIGDINNAHNRQERVERDSKEGPVRAGVLPAVFDFEAHKKLVPMRPGYVQTTYADATALERDFGFVPKIPLREGLRKFAEWYKQFYDRK